MGSPTPIFTRTAFKRPLSLPSNCPPRTNLPIKCQRLFYSASTTSTVPTMASQTAVIFSTTLPPVPVARTGLQLPAFLLPLAPVTRTGIQPPVLLPPVPVAQQMPPPPAFPLSPVPVTRTGPQPAVFPMPPVPVARTGPQPSVFPMPPVPVARTGPQPLVVPIPLPIYQLRSDNLGKSALLSASLLSSGLSFEDLCNRHRGPSCLSDPTLLPHASVPILSSLRSTGAPANQTTPTWALDQLDVAATRGPHQSTRDHIDFMRQEFFDMVNAGQWLVLPYSAVRHLPGLRLSLTGVVPQRDRRPRPIVDYTYSGINAGTDSQAPDSIQFGASFHRFLRHLQRANTRRGTIRLAKTDISDAFMRV
jgi:hypothetical protein